jgi:hypothetical protein
MDVEAALMFAARLEIALLVSLSAMIYPMMIEQERHTRERCRLVIEGV